MDRLDSLFVSLMGAAGVAALVTVSGCAEPAFSAHLRDNSVEDVTHAMAVARADTGARRPATAYLLTAGEKHLVSYDLEGARVNWEIAADVSSRIAVGRGFFAHRQGKAQIAVRSSQNGSLRCTLPLKSDEEFLGIAADTRVYYVVQTLTGRTRRSFLVAVAPDGCGEVWRNEAAMSIGAPAVRGDLVAVPYAYQNVVLLDGKTGNELARIRATDEAVSFVRATPEGLYYGDNKGIYLFDQRSAAGSKKGSSYAQAHLASSQIRLFFYWDGYQPSQADYTAFDRNRLLWRGEAKQGGVAFRDDLAILHSYRYFFAFDANRGTIRWAYSHPRVDLVASDDTGPSVVFVSVDGELGALDAKTGAAVWSKPTGFKVAGATFDADGFTPPGAQGEAPPLMKTLTDIVTDPDARFTAVKVFAIAAMQNVPGQDVTELLVKTVTKEGVAPAVAKAAADALLQRKDAEAKPIYREALTLHYDYLNDRRVHGVDVLAKVVAEVRDQETTPLLGAHLMDAATPLAALKEIIRAQITLGGQAAIQSINDFLLTYRSDPAFNADPLPLQLAADGLLKLAGPAGRRVALFVAEERRTLPSLTDYIQRVLDGTASEPAPTAKVTAAAAASGARTGAAKATAASKGGKPAAKAGTVKTAASRNK